MKLVKWTVVEKNDAGNLVPTGQSRYWFWCPGCEGAHCYSVGGPEGWEFNNDMENPTFSPSLMMPTAKDGKPCHLWVRNGMIEFCGDCHHELAGQTVALPEVPDWMK